MEVNLEEAPPYSFGSREEPGFYYGSATDVTDLLNFWNLRACDVDLLFYDPAQIGRLQPLIAAYGGWLRQRPKRATSFPDIAVWKKDHDVPGDLGIFGEGVSLSAFDPIIFNGLNLNPSLMTFAAKSVLGASLENGLGTGVAFQLPEKPFLADTALHVQKVVVSVTGPNIGSGSDARAAAGPGAGGGDQLAETAGHEVNVSVHNSKVSRSSSRLVVHTPTKHRPDWLPRQVLHLVL
jgi:hypothetical protein